jgi:hypothetical protein
MEDVKLQFHTPNTTGFNWSNKTHLMVALVSDKKVIINAYSKTCFMDKDEELTLQLNDSNILKEYLVEKRKELLARKI